MSGSKFTLLPKGASADDVWRAVNQLIFDANGSSAWQRTKSYTGVEDDTQYVMTIENQDVGGHLNVPNELQVESDGSGTTIRQLGAGATTLASLTVTGNTALGNADTDTLTVVGISTFRNAAAAVQLFVDAGNNRVIAGSATPLGSDTTPNLQVVGRLYVAPEAANDLAVQIRRSSAATVGWSLGVTAANDFAFKDDADTLIATIHDVAFPNYSMTLEGGVHVKGPGDFDGPMSLGNAAGDAIDIRGTPTLFAAMSSGAGIGINIGGSSIFGAGLTITTGGLTVTAGGVTVNSGGVVFPATEVPSADANTLDDYEEGSWTPSVGGSATYTDQTGSYVKIGRQVTVWGRLAINVIGTGSTGTISGLPFVADITAAGFVSVWTSLSVNIVQIGVNTVGSNSTLALVGASAAAASAAVLTPLQNGSAIRFTVTYTTAN